MHFQALNNKRPSPQRRLRLAVFGNRGSAYLRAGVCASAVRRGFIVGSFCGSLSSYQDMLMDDQSDLYTFNPDAVLLALDPAQLSAHEKHVARSSSIAKQHLGASLIQRTILSVFPAMIDTDEPPSKSHAFLLNLMRRDLQARFDREDIHLSFFEERIESGILLSWSEPPIWRRKKQSARSEPSLLDGNPLARLLSAVGRFSYNCLMLDVSKHPETTGNYDLDVFVADRYGTGLFSRSQIESRLRPDLLLLVDEGPLIHRPFIQRSSVYTMPGQREKL
jgi:hypothetical protein